MQSAKCEMGVDLKKGENKSRQVRICHIPKCNTEALNFRTTFFYQIGRQSAALVHSPGRKCPAVIDSHNDWRCPSKI